MIKIDTSGQKPKLSRFTTEQSLLIAAWAYGLKKNEEIHRLALFAFVQSHITNATEENLQGFIAKDVSNWTSIEIGTGYYKLTSSAFEQLYKFGKQNIILPKKIVYIFKRNIESDEINVTVDAIQEKYIIRQNNIEMKAAIVIENIINITKETIPTDSTSKPRKVLNWVLSGEDYTWKIESNVEDTIS